MIILIVINQHEKGLVQTNSKNLSELLSKFIFDYFTNYMINQFTSILYRLSTLISKSNMLICDHRFHIHLKKSITELGM